MFNITFATFFFQFHFIFHGFMKDKESKTFVNLLNCSQFIVKINFSLLFFLIKPFCVAFYFSLSGDENLNKINTIISCP